MPAEYLVLGGLATVLGAVSYLFGYRRSAARYDLIREVPTLQARDVPGLGAATVELKGIAQVESALLSDLARVACVAFESQVTEHWSTTRVRRDANGRSRTVTEHHSEIRHHAAQRIPFQVQDASGCVTVRPEGADLEMLDGMELRGLDEPLSESVAAQIRPRHFGGHLRYSDMVLPVGLQVYVLGEVTEDNAIAAAAEGNRPFVISYRSEDDLVKRAWWGKCLFGLLTLVLLAAAVTFFGLGLSTGLP